MNVRTHLVGYAHYRPRDDAAAPPSSSASVSSDAADAAAPRIVAHWLWLLLLLVVLDRHCLLRVSSPASLMNERTVRLRSNAHDETPASIQARLIDRSPPHPH